MRRTLALLFLIAAILPGCIVFEPSGSDARTDGGRYPEQDLRHQHIQDMRPDHQNDFEITFGGD